MAKKARRKLTKEERAAKRAQARERMAAAVDALGTSEGWKRWLAVRHRFHHYSFKNQLLIAHQRPGATWVASFSHWLKLGYCVRKGEHSIRIWKPCDPSKKEMERWRKEGADPTTRPKRFFILVPVFDRAQVDPLPDFEGERVELDPPSEPVFGDSLAHLIEPLRYFAATIGCSVEFVSIPGSPTGSYHPAIGKIQVDQPTPNGRVKTLLHELAHALLDREREDDDPVFTYLEEEVVVECIAFSVCSSAGFDTSGFSVPYVAGWSRGGEIERYGALIDRLARRLEDVVLDTEPAHPAAEPTPEPAALVAA
jgi:antirestriction protein ArdC